MKITKSKLKQIIKEELAMTLREDENIELSTPEAVQLYKEGKAFLDKVMALGKNDDPNAGEVMDALGDYVKEASHGYVKVMSLY